MARAHDGSMIADALVAAAVTMVALTSAASVCAPYFRARIIEDFLDGMRRVGPVRIAKSAGAL